MTSEQRLAIPPAPALLRNGVAVCVRPLTPEDGEALADLYVSVPREDARFYLCPSLLTREHALSEASATDSPDRVDLMLETADGAMVGYAWYRWDGAYTEASLFGICIRREYQGHGAGALLLTHINAIARTLGPPVISLTVQQANARAAALYQKMGFTIIREQELSERDGFPAEPEWYMERRTR